ncbi:phosphatase PAP2 family protein [Kordiimonas marina]|uniref:phosphatase PAP2 family protein n=1 Tax=Kordiimonas marina TaxID=2872312 RepID=UPI001FF4963A|nr:phosphatase PAP2 family protein [Kordiimonas marina]MCJ9428803.1 phosphatase PAP2 family protein [Kordiimonas marina]
MADKSDAAVHSTDGSSPAGKSLYTRKEKLRIIVFAGIGTAWAGLANSGALSGFDRGGLLFFRQAADTSVLIGPSWTGSFALGLSHIGGTVALIALCLGLVGLVWRREGGARAGLYALAITGGMLIVTVLKHLFNRARPEVVSHLMHETSASFPSGHATRSTVVYLIVTMFLAQVYPAYRRAILTLALLMALAVGVSRVMVGVHWPSDVIGGWFTALFWLSLWYPVLGRAKP